MVGWKLGGREWALTAFVFSSPAIGVAIARPLVEVVHELMGWISGQPLKRWEGRYYEFGGVQVRIFEHDGALWFVTTDVAKAAGIPDLPEELARGRTIPGTRLKTMAVSELESVLLTHRGPETMRFLLWARREVLAPWERKRGKP
jgi:hypothetical protein